MARRKKPKQVPESHPRAIHCERHGVTVYCLICRHLHKGTGLGFLACKPLPDRPAQAWCEACDKALEKDRGWSDRADAKAGWKVYCTGCYEETLARHDHLYWSQGTDG